jgi:hypothetical protein
MATAAAPAARMDPAAGLPEGEVLILSPLAAAAPFAPRTGIVAGFRALVQWAVPAPAKPLRPPKERHPVADSVDPGQVRGHEAPVTIEEVAPGTAAPPSPPATLRTFVGGSDNDRSIPPDTSGAVGIAHIVNPHNNDIWIYDRSGTEIQHLTLDSFWSALGLTGSTFDPKIVYDPHRDRFIFVTMAQAQQADSGVYVAVTTSGDPTGGWIADAIQVDDAAQGEVWLDYPSLGFTADKVTVQVNLYTRDGNRFAGSTIYVIDKASLYDPPHQPSLQRFVLRNQGATHVPAVTYDPGMADQYLLARWSPNIQGDGSLALYRITGRPGPSPAQLSRVGFIAAGGHIWESFPPGDFAPQADRTENIDVGDDRLLGVVLRGNRLYAVHTVMLPAGGATRSAIQWWEIDLATMTIQVLGRVDDAAAQQFYAFPTLAVNADGDLLLGCSQFSAATHPSGSFVLRRHGQAAQPAQVFAAGRASYFKTFSGTDNRWGDYSATQVDPVDDHNFWTVQEYAAARDTWGTMWALIQP